MQPRSRTGADAFLDGIVAVGVEAPALGKIDDADRCVAIGGDEDHPAHRLRPRRKLARQQAAVRIDAAEMNQDRRAFGKHAAVGQHQRRNLAERIDSQQFLERVVRLPRCRFDDAIRRARNLQPDLRCRRTRSFLAIEGKHRFSHA